MDEIARYASLLKEHILNNYRGMFRDAGEALPYPFIAPGSQQYHDQLWDWDSWMSSIAVCQAAQSAGADAVQEARDYQRGCILNYLHFGGMQGRIPIVLDRTGDIYRPDDIYRANMHKPVLAQHAAFLVREASGDAEWLRDKFYFMLTFLGKYKHHHRHRCGLYFWENDAMIGVDDDPSTYFRPPRSSGSILLNCLMFAELHAAAYIADRLNLDEVAVALRQDAADLHAAVQEHCWDERDGFFYSVDLNLRPAETTGLHAGAPRTWDCLIQRLGVWSGFLALWSGIATPEQAERIVQEHYRNTRTFNASYGVRSLSKLEKMYTIRASGNPSCWLGPVWGLSSYLVFRGLVRYGFDVDARQLAEKTIRLFGRDIERHGGMHEYYQPENGEPVLNRGFMNWNYLVLNMIAWSSSENPIKEFQV
jgi:putative isomerase